MNPCKHEYAPNFCGRCGAAKPRTPIIVPVPFIGFAFPRRICDGNMQFYVGGQWNEEVLAEHNSADISVWADSLVRDKDWKNLVILAQAADIYRQLKKEAK